MRSKVFLGPLVSLALSIGVVGLARANDESATKTESETIAVAGQSGTQTEATADDSLTWLGITLYGKIDVGVAYQTHGAPLNLDSAQGLNYVIAKSSNKPLTTLAPNGLSPSIIGVKGEKELVDGFSGIFKLETGFDLLSLRLANGPQSLVHNNGRSLATQTSSNDSNQAGQLDNTAGYVGINSKNYGTLTFGRQNGLLADKVVEYDPNGASYAFSVAGGSSAVRGIGVTQSARLNSSLKYTDQIGWLRVGGQYQFSGKQYTLFGTDGTSGSATEISLGGNYGKFSTDFIYGHKNGAISAASLSSIQLLTQPADSLAATVSDNTSYTVLGKYDIDRATAYVGYERIQFANPSTHLSAGTDYLGGYKLSVLTQNAYNINKVLQVYWVGLKYSVTPKLTLTGTYYAYNQNSYATGNNFGCSNSSNPKCSGTLDAESIVAIYKLTKRMDVYGGIMRSAVQNGLASGYLNTSNLNTMAGGRYTF